MRSIGVLLWVLWFWVACAQIGCMEPCPQNCTPGQQRCSTQGILMCSSDARTGCYVWGLLPCGVGEFCVVEAGSYVCRSAGPTTEQCQKNPHFEKKCVGADIFWFDACGRQRDFFARCSTSTRCVEGACQPLSSTPGCKPGQLLCYAGAQRCVGVSFQRCERDEANKCTGWSLPKSCPDGQYCREGSCTATPKNCPNICQAGAQRCVGVALQTCEANQITGCLEWSNLQTCPDGQYCQNGACRKAPGGCKNQCQAGSVRCAGDKLQPCLTDASGCLVWSTPRSCLQGQVCKDNLCQVVQKNCTDLCQSGATRCIGVALQRCERASSGCLEWTNPVPCPTGQSCQNGACAGDGSCQDQCQENMQQCLGIVIQSCLRQGKCTRWVQTRQCGANQNCKMDAGKGTCTCKQGFKPAPDGRSCEPDTGSQLDCGMLPEEKRVHEIVNQERQKRGLPALKCHANIVREARKWSEKQCQRGYIGHDGASSRVRATGLSWSTWGENVAAGQRTPESVMNAWMNSSGHRANILNRAFSHLGVGYNNCGNRYRYYWTQIFLKLR